MQKQREKITRQIPHNIEAEQNLLGCLMYDSSIAINVLHTLKSDDFYSEANRLIFESMQTLSRTNKAIDLVTVSDELEKNGNMSNIGGINYLVDLQNSVVSTANYNYYLNIVKRDGTLRRIIRAATQIIEFSSTNTNEEDAIAYAEKKIYDISANSESSKLTSLATEFRDVVDRFQEYRKNPNAFSGMSTGLVSLDNKLNGLQRGDLILLSARPGYGKTSLAMNIVENMAMDGKTCVVFSLEMPKRQIAQRMLCSVAEVPMAKGVRGELETHDFVKLIKTTNSLESTNIYIDDSSQNTVPLMLSKCRRLAAQKGAIDLIMVDYIQLMSGENRENRQQEVSEISRGLKLLAKEINVPVLALSQLSREVEKRQSNVPVLSDLRESGAIEQDADIVMFIHRPDKVEANAEKVKRGEIPKDIAQLIIAKFRNGETGSIKLKWNGAYTKFSNYTADADEIFAASQRLTRAEQDSLQEIYETTDGLEQ